jgi:hypothetical protein
MDIGTMTSVRRVSLATKVKVEVADVVLSDVPNTVEVKSYVPGTNVFSGTVSLGEALELKLMEEKTVLLRSRHSDWVDWSMQLQV